MSVMSPPATDTPARPYTCRRVGELLGLSERTIQRAIREGRIAGVRVGRVWRIPAREVERLVGADLPAGGAA